MNAQTMITAIGAITASLVLVAGILVLSGLVIPDSVPENIRVIFGIVLVLYGLYRAVTIWTKRQQKRDDDE